MLRDDSARCGEKQLASGRALHGTAFEGSGKPPLDGAEIGALVVKAGASSRTPKKLALKFTDRRGGKNGYQAEEQVSDEEQVCEKDGREKAGCESRARWER
jgi:hypothetical protein